MVGAAVRGLSKILRKKLKKAPVLGKYARRGTPTKAGLVARRKALRGASMPEGVKKIKKSGAIDFTSGAGAGLLTGYVFGTGKAKKEAKAKETKEKLKKATEEHKKKTKEKRKKYGKHHG